MQARNTGTGHIVSLTSLLTYSPNRWRPFEAALAACGSVSEDILECLEDEEASGRPKPIDVEYLLASVIPNLLSLSREHTPNPLPQARAN